MLMMRICDGIGNGKYPVVSILNCHAKSTLLNEQHIIESVAHSGGAVGIEPDLAAVRLKHGPLVCLWVKDLKQMDELSGMGRTGHSFPVPR